MLTCLLVFLLPLSPLSPIPPRKDFFFKKNIFQGCLLRHLPPPAPSQDFSRRFLRAAPAEGRLAPAQLSAEGWMHFASQATEGRPVSKPIKGEPRVTLDLLRRVSAYNVCSMTRDTSLKCCRSWRTFTHWPCKE